MKPNFTNNLAACLLLSTLCLVVTFWPPASAQFLFTYEINQEDDSRAPKSSLFDPSSFRIVTPSQLQNSYQKLSTEPIEVPPAPLANSNDDSASSPSGSSQLEQGHQQVAGAGAGAGAGASEPSRQHDDGSFSSSPSGSSSSLLKQTSAALQSFAELFSLSPSSSPAPLGGNSLQDGQVDQQAEARSLHEHWTQQQQKSHQQHQQQQQLGSVLAPQPIAHQHQHHNQQQVNSAGPQASLANAALNSFTTTPTSNQVQHHLQQQQQQQASSSGQQSPPASYWLTANPLSSPDGNYLVQIKQPQVSSPASNMVDNLLSIAHRPSGSSSGSGGGATSFQSSVARSPKQSAQSSFLSTPTSYYPSPNSVESSTRVSPIHQQVSVHESSSGGATTSGAHRAVPVDHFGAPAAPVVVPPQRAPQHHHHQQQQQQAFAHTTVPSRLSLRELPADLGQQLQPPANAPENYVPQTVGVGRPLHKSAEESLISFRHQQQHQHEQQNALFAAQQQFANQVQQAGGSGLSETGQSSAAAAAPHSTSQFNQFNQPAQQVPQTFQQKQHPQATGGGGSNHGDIPKVSPQIYESFLLQQRDQHEKHMELLKQQQELNKLLEQKHKQQEAELKRKRKKEELDKEARKKVLREQEAARKLKLEQEERESLRRRRDEEERKRVVEERRYREYLEAREREAAQLKRRAEEEEQRARAQKAAAAAAEREREQAEMKEKRRLLLEQQAAAVVQQQEKRKREEEAAVKYANYLRQQEELKKLIELKQKEDEALQQRRKQVVAAQQQQQQQQQQHQPQPPQLLKQQQQQQQQRHAQAGRANRLAAEHRERANSGATANSGGQASQWGTPLRLRGQVSPSSLSPTSTTTATTSTTTTTTTANEPSFSASPASTESPIGRLTGPTSSAGSGPEQTAPTQEAQRPKLRGRQVVMVRQKLKGDDKLIRQKIPNYTGPGQYGLYRGANDSIANDLAALLDSVTLPSSTSSTTPPSSGATSAGFNGQSTSTTGTPEFASTGSRRFDLGSNVAVTPSDNLAARMSSSLSPLLQQQQPSSAPALPAANQEQPNEPFFDDDVPRRPARGLSASGQQRHRQQVSGPNQQLAVSSSRQQASRFFNESSFSTASPSQSSQSQSNNNGNGNGRSTAHIGLASLPPDSDNDGIPGRAGVEYPILSSVPPTSFSCSKQPLNGYYADTETACQVVHLCQGGSQSSILCPNGTIFNQEKFSCQWWYEVNCSRAPIFYQLNDNLYKATTLPPGEEALSSSSSSSDSKRNKLKNKESRGANQLAV